MGPFLAKRFVQLIPVVWGVGTLVFLLLHLVPGDPVDIMLGESAQQGGGPLHQVGDLAGQS